MTRFDERERAFESKFAHDAEMQFRAEARRNRKLGFWAAELLGKEGDEAADYAKEVVKSDFEEAGDEDVLRKVSSDLEGHVSQSQVREKMDELMVEAKAELVSET